MSIRLFLQVSLLIAFLYIIVTLLQLQFTSLCNILIERYFKEKEAHYDRLVDAKVERFKEVINKVEKKANSSFN